VESGNQKPPFRVNVPPTFACTDYGAGKVTPHCLREDRHRMFEEDEETVEKASVGTSFAVMLSCGDLGPKITLEAPPTQSLLLWVSDPPEGQTGTNSKSSIVRMTQILFVKRLITTHKLRLKFHESNELHQNTMNYAVAKEESKSIKPCHSSECNKEDEETTRLFLL
jgi:hypothetical protein